MKELLIQIRFSEFVSADKIPTEPRNYFYFQHTTDRIFGVPRTSVSVSLIWKYEEL